MRSIKIKASSCYNTSNLILLTASLMLRFTLIQIAMFKIYQVYLLYINFHLKRFTIYFLKTYKGYCWYYAMIFRLLWFVLYLWSIKFIQILYVIDILLIKRLSNTKKRKFMSCLERYRSVSIYLLRKQRGFDKILRLISIKTY